MINNNLDAINNNIKYTILLCITCFISNISQIPAFFGNFEFKCLILTIWGFTFILAIFDHLIVFNKKIFFPIIMLILFSIFIMICELLEVGAYVTSVFLYPVLLSISIFLIGFFIAPKVNARQLNYVMLFYTLAAIITSIFIYNHFSFFDFDWESRTYIYGSKNSISQIILTAIIYLAIKCNFNNKLFILLKWSGILGWVIFLLMLKSRATLISIPFIVLIILLFSRIKMSIKVMVVFIATTFIILLLVNQDFYNLIITNVILGASDASNLNVILSGRMDHLTQFMIMFPNNPFLGAGSFYLESFPLSVLLQFGILGAIPLFAIVLYPLWCALCYFDKKKSSNIFFLCIVIIYLLNGVFEEQAPFGPGVKCYMMWLLFGILLRWESIKKENTG